MYSNCYCICSFNLEIKKIGQSSHNMYSNNLLNFQDSTIMLNAYTKKSENLSYAPRISRLIAKRRSRRRSHLTEGGEWKNIPLDCEEET